MRLEDQVTKTYNELLLIASGMFFHETRRLEEDSATMNKCGCCEAVLSTKPPCACRTRSVRIMCAMSHSLRVCGDVPSLPEVNEDRYVMVSFVAGITAVWRKRKAACRAARIGTEAQRYGSEQRRRQAHRDANQRRCVTLVRVAWLFVVFSLLRSAQHIFEFVLCSKRNTVPLYSLQGDRTHLSCTSYSGQALVFFSKLFLILHIVHWAERNVL